MRLVARSVLSAAAAWTPTRFSSALPAIATTTSPTKASDRPMLDDGLSDLDEEVGQSAQPGRPRRQDADGERQRPGGPRGPAGLVAGRRASAG